MKIKKEIREERNDIYSFWKDNIKTDVSGNNFTIEEKLDENTLNNLSAEKAELVEKLDEIEVKINLILNYLQ